MADVEKLGELGRDGHSLSPALLAPRQHPRPPPGDKRVMGIGGMQIRGGLPRQGCTPGLAIDKRRPPDSFGRAPEMENAMPAMDEYDRAGLAAHPPLLSPAYGSSRSRAPSQLPVSIPQTLSELTGPLFGHDRLSPGDADLTPAAPWRANWRANHRHGPRLCDEGWVPFLIRSSKSGKLMPPAAIGMPVRSASNAPLDPNFTGCGPR